MNPSPAALLALFGILTPGDNKPPSDITPILAERCFTCHGPDSETREADLRLDTREAFFEDRGGYALVVPGDLDASELYVRIAADDDERMPPPKSGPALSSAQVEAIVAWIEAGAVWEEHWSFVPPREVQPPEVSTEEWVRDPVDRFVLARLEREGVAPAKPTDAARLLRRVALDLNGVPPTPGEVAAFVA